MYPWFLPWLPYIAPGTHSVIDSTSFIAGVDFTFKSTINEEYLTGQDNDFLSFISVLSLIFTTSTPSFVFTQT
jgi:hypothetical protein